MKPQTTKKKRKVGFKEGIWVCRKGHAIELPAIKQLKLSPCSPCPKCCPEYYEAHDGK